MQPLVSVIIPAYNAEATIAETLRTVLWQTYSNIEIIIVDDGSTDRTLGIIKKLSEQHEHIKVITQSNGGVAVARNTAIEASRGTYVAPIDADDLWHPERVERHVRALETAGEDTAVAYSPFYVIDKESNVLGKSRNYDLSGEVFSAHLKYNPVGNGSGMLVRKEALQKVGGYSSLLLERGAQGCEDYLVQLELAYSYKFISVPDYLIGYRHYPGRMSSDKIRMLRSQLLMYEYIEKNYGVNEKALRNAKHETIAKLALNIAKAHGVSHFGREILLHSTSLNNLLLIQYHIFKFASHSLYKLMPAEIFIKRRKTHSIFNFFGASVEQSSTDDVAQSLH